MPCVQFDTIACGEGEGRYLILREAVAFGFVQVVPEEGGDFVSVDCEALDGRGQEQTDDNRV